MNRSVSLILKFLNIFEDREVEHQEVQRNTYPVKVKNQNSEETKSFPMTYHSTLKDLRRKICEAFKIGNHTF